MESLIVYFICLVAFPLVPIFDILSTIVRCTICLLGYPFYAIASLLCLPFNRLRAFKILDYWRKVANIGTKYEEKIQ